MRSDNMKTNETKPLLRYGISNQPSPLQVSTEEAPSRGRLNISVFNPQGVYCNKFDICIPQGEDEDALFADFPEISVNSGEWVIFGESISNSYAVFTMMHREGVPKKIEGSVTFSVLGNVSKYTGVSEIYVYEYSSEEPVFPEEPRESKFTREKVTPEFYVNNFMSSDPNNYSVPCGMFACGKPIRLSWESNGTYFKLYKKNETQPFWEGSGTSCTLTDGCESATTFILAASMSGDWALDMVNSDSLYAPIIIYRDLTVTISNPKLTLTALSVDGETALNNALRVKGNAELGGKLGVSGELRVDGKTNLSDVLRVDSIETTSSQVPALTVSAPINTKGLHVTEGAALLDAGATVKGALDMRETVNFQVFDPSSAQVFSSKKSFALEFNCDSDGIMIPYMYCSKAFSWITIAEGTKDNYIAVEATGTPMVKDDVGTPNAGIYPFYKDKKYYIWSVFHGDNDICYTLLFFFPFGKGKVTIEQEKLNAKKIEELKKTLPPQLLKKSDEE